MVQKKLDASNKKKWRLFVDYKKLNNETIENRFPISLIDYIFDKLLGQHFFNPRFGKGILSNRNG